MRANKTTQRSINTVQSHSRRVWRFTRYVFFFFFYMYSAGQHGSDSDEPDDNADRGDVLMVMRELTITDVSVIAPTAPSHVRAAAVQLGRRTSAIALNASSTANVAG